VVFEKVFADSLPLLGGTCNEKLAAKTWDGMVKAMTKNVVEKAPGCRKGDGGNAQRGFEEIGQRDEAKMGGGSAGLNGFRGDPSGVIRVNYRA
jgi:hypothetical protein